MSRVLTTASNTTEAALIEGRLQEAGIRCVKRPVELAYRGAGGGCDILVEDQDLGRARQILADEEGGFDEQELARLSEQAAAHAREGEPAPPASEPAAQPPAADRQRGLAGWLGRRRSGSRDSPFGR